MGVKSLAELCTAVCFKNIREITDVGGLPYTIVRPILLKIDSAVQLRAIEEASPHIAVENAECWIRLIERKFAVLHAKNQYEPRNPASWHKVYAKYAKLDAQKKAEAAENLKNAFAGIQRQKEANQSTIHNLNSSSLPRPPRDMKGLGRKGASGRRGGNNDTGELRFTGGSRTKTNTAASVMRKVKREVAEISARNKINTPNRALAVRTGQIKRAPKGMVHEQRIKNNPAVKALPPTMKSREEEFRDQVMEEREARLRKLKDLGKTSSIIEDSDLDEDDADDVFGENYGHGTLNEEDLENLFDEDEAPAKSYSAKSDSDSGPSNRTSAAPAKKKTLLSNAYRPSTSASVYRAGSSTSTPARTVAKASAQDSPPPAPISPPKPTSSTGGSSGSPELKPRMPVKRKAVDVFMKPKGKVQRR